VFQTRTRAAARYAGASLYSHEEFLHYRHFRGFDGVRAVAALMVVAFHFGGSRFAFLSGWLGVHLFFVLSGFLITTLLLREEERTGKVSLGNFYIRRAFRILPAFYVALGATAAYLVAVGRTVSDGVFSSLGYYATFLPEFAPTGYFGHSWTLGIEEKFYVVWPILGFALLMRFRHQGIWRISILLALGAAALVFPGILIHYAVIGLGAALAIVMDSDRGFRAIRFLTIRWVAVSALIVFAVVQISAGTLIAIVGSQIPIIFVYGLAATLMLPGLVAFTPTTRALSWAPLRWLGQRSYSIYLVQFLAGIVVTSVLSMAGFGLVKTVLVAAVAAAIADLIYRGVESPAIALGKRITQRRSAAKKVPVSRDSVTQIA
jgi:peptidoglycan/LPS O-acetylase OafA/YrhL